MSNSGKSGFLHFIETSHDFGELGQYQEVAHVFKFKNKSTVKVTLGECRAECGCTVTLLDKKVLEPGESGTLKVTLQTLSMQGNLIKKIYVNIVEPTKDSQILKVKVNIIKRINIVPSSLNFGRVLIGKKVEQSFFIIPGDKVKTLKGTVVESNQPVISTSITDTPLPRYPEGTLAVKCELKPCSSAKIVDTFLTIRTPDTETGNMKVPIHGIIVPPVESFPKKVNWFAKKPAEVFDAKLLLRNNILTNQKSRIEVKNVSYRREIVPFESHNTNAGVVVKTKLLGPSLPGFSEEQLKIEIAGDWNGVLGIPVVCYVKPQAIKASKAPSSGQESPKNHFP